MKTLAQLRESFNESSSGSDVKDDTGQVIGQVRRNGKYEKPGFTSYHYEGHETEEDQNSDSTPDTEYHDTLEAGIAHVKAERAARD